jgi:hypothetical protein
VNAVYAEAAPRYLEAGWLGVLPVGHRPRQKREPPTGYTGHDGRWPSPEDIALWQHDAGDVNVALRLPRGVIGIDVDDYDGKRGADTMAAGAERHGRLPPTWTSTSRDGLSGIRLFRVPDNAEFPGQLRHPVRRGQSDVELIQHHHRYAVVAPSVHPEGRTYRWLGPDGEPAAIPSPDQLPELPAGWRDHLAEACSCFAGAPIVIASGDPVADKLAEARAGLAGNASRHESVIRPVMALIGFRNRGFPGAAEALEALKTEFLAAVTTPGRGTVRSLKEAEGEWARMTQDGQAAAAGAGRPAWDSDSWKESDVSVEPALEATPWPDPPAPAAFHGVLGDIALAVAPYTEADPVGVLGTVIAMFGAACGGARTFYQGSLQRTNLSILLVGETGFRGRKGTALDVGRAVFRLAYPDIAARWLVGVASGAAIAGHLTRKDDQGCLPDPRVLLVETEFGRLLTIMNREGSTLSAVLRNAWDGVPLGHARARDESLVTDHHVSLLGHVTPIELRAKLTDTDAANGFANRLLFLAVRRSRLIPFPTAPDELVGTYTEPLHRAIVEAHAPGEMTFDEAAKDRWEEFYLALASTPRMGLAGALTGRHEAQVARLALVYALADRSLAIGVAHLEAAIALADYARRSVTWAFGDSTGNRHADVLRRMLAEGDLAWKDAKLALGLRTAADMDEAVHILVDAGLAETVLVPQPTGGRGRRVIRAKGAKSAKDARGARSSEEGISA